MFLKFLLIRTRVMLLATMALLGGALAPTAVLAGQFAYVPGGDVAVIDLTDNSVNTVAGSPITVGNVPRGIAITPDQTRAVVTNSADDTVSVIDLATNTVDATIAVGASPSQVAITPDGTRAYVTNQLGNSVSVIDLDSNMVDATIDVSGTVVGAERPRGIAISPDGTKAYVTTPGRAPNDWRFGVAVIDVEFGSPTYNMHVDTITVGRAPLRVTFSPDGALAYVANWLGVSVSVIDVASNAVVATIPVNGRPTDIAITPDGTRAYVPQWFVADVLEVIDVVPTSGTYNTVVDTIAGLDGLKNGIAITPDGTHAYVTMQSGSNGVGVVAIDVDPMSGTYNMVVDQITGFLAGPFDIAIAEVDTNEAPTADAGDDQAIRAGDTVNLDGSDSFDDNTASVDLVYAWSFFSLPGGSTATLSGANTATPSFVADVAGTYTVELVVTDEGPLDSDPDFVDISSDNLAPTAAAGDDQLVIVGTAVVLDGSGSSDPEMDALTFDWSITSAPAGSTATISDSDMESAGLTPDLEGVYEAALSVSDFIGLGTPDTVAITAATAEGFAEIQIMSANDVVAGLTAGQVTTGGNQNAFTKLLSQAIAALMKDPPDVAKAIDKLEQALLRTDGCTLRGSPDVSGPEKRDWITDCDAQNEIYGLLSAALGALMP